MLSSAPSLVVGIRKRMLGPLHPLHQATVSRNGARSTHTRTPPGRHGAQPPHRFPRDPAPGPPAGVGGAGNAAASSGSARRLAGVRSVRPREGSPFLISPGTPTGSGTRRGPLGKAGPYGANVEDSVCCRDYMRRPLAPRVVKYFYWTSDSCRRPGVVLVTLKGLEICADPRLPWVKKILRKLEQ